MVIYVQDMIGNPLMPTTRAGWVRRSLKSGKAEVMSLIPFTVRLTYEPETRETQPLICGVDPGRTNIGMSVVREDGRCVYASECVTHNKEVPKRMLERRCFRQASRRGERLARKRLAKRLGTTTKKVLERILPGYEKPVKVKDIINTEARFNNRKRKEGWLTPTATQLLRTHENLLRKVMQILPLTDVVLEVNRFAFMALEDPGLKKIDYCHGPLYGKNGVNEAVYEMQGGRCLLCGSDIAEYHHIIPRKKGGSDTIPNLAGLCEGCHILVHNDAEQKKKLKDRKSGLNKKYGALSVLNQIIPSLTQKYQEMFRGHVYVTNGWNTKQYREEHVIGKGHGRDAYCMACSIIQGQPSVDVLDEVYLLKQFRRHDRANIKAQKERTYYLDGKKAAKNRHKRMDQKEDSLEDWYKAMAEAYGTEEAEGMRSRLTVKKSTRSYNRRDRLMPGTIYYYEGNRYVMTGQLSGGKYLRAYGHENKNFPVRKCTIVQQNTGIVYVGKRAA